MSIFIVSLESADGNVTVEKIVVARDGAEAIEIAESETGLEGLEAIRS